MVKGMYSSMTRQSARAIPVSKRLIGLPLKITFMIWISYNVCCSGALKVSKMAEEQFQLFEEIDIFLFLRGFTRENINVFRKILNKQEDGANHSHHS